MPKIKHGYYLKARQIKNSSVHKTSPCTREVWDYLLREAKFDDSETLKTGQLIRSYQKIADDLAWKVGARTVKYDTNQIKKAMVFFREHKMVVTKRIPRAVLITICNYKYFQDKTNYESTRANAENPWKIKYLELLKSYESTKTACESTRKQRLESTSESTSESTRHESANHCNNKELDSKINHESTSESTDESTSESTRNQRFIDNIHQYKSIDNIILDYNRNFPCQEDELDFERDRRIFFHAFPGVKTFQTFDDKKERSDKKLAKIIHIKKDFMPAYMDMSFDKGNDMGAGIYLCINETDGRGRAAKNIVKVRSVFADLDGSPLEPVWEYEPSMVVESSPGKFHAYWFTSDTPLESFTILQESIAQKFNSDPVVKDLSRVMRVPGFNHMKGEPFLSRIIHYTGRDHTFGYLVEIFPPIPREQWSAPKYQKPVNGDGEFRGQYGASKGGRNNHIITRVGGMLKRGLSWTDIEQEAFKEASACSPPLPDKEVREILRSARRYA